MEETNSVIVTGGNHPWNSNRCHLFLKIKNTVKFGEGLYSGKRQVFKENQTLLL
jgi:hypothetical protein